MFVDDIELVRYAVDRYDGRPPYVDVGGLTRPCVADYHKTIALMERLSIAGKLDDAAAVRQAQFARFLNLERPLSFLGPYAIENPENGGLSIEDLRQRYVEDTLIGTAILLSVLEHVDQPFAAACFLAQAMRPGALLIVSVPWEFPYHPSPEDHWRFSPTGLRRVVNGYFEVLEADWRLDIPADAGVLDIKTGRPQAIRSAYLIGRRAA